MHQTGLAQRLQGVGFFPTFLVVAGFDLVAKAHGLGRNLLFCRSQVFVELFEVLFGVAQVAFLDGGQSLGPRTGSCSGLCSDGEQACAQQSDGASPWRGALGTVGWDDSMHDGLRPGRFTHGRSDRRVCCPLNWGPAYRMRSIAVVSRDRSWGQGERRSRTSPS